MNEVFDLVFIDGGKSKVMMLFEAVMKKTNGSDVILSDNVCLVWQGRTRTLLQPTR